MLSAIQQFFTDLWDSLTQTMSNPDMAAQLVQPISGLLQLLTPLLALFTLIRCGRSAAAGGRLKKRCGAIWSRRPDRFTPPPLGNLIGRSAGVMWCSTSPPSPAVTPPSSGTTPVSGSSIPSTPKMASCSTAPPHGAGTGAGRGPVRHGWAGAGLFAGQRGGAPRPGPAAHQAGTVHLPRRDSVPADLFQATLCFKLLLAYQGNPDAPPILPCFGVLAGSMWFLYLLYRILKRRGFEIETIAFFLTTLCLTITANGIPKSLAKQTVCIVLGLVCSSS